jgi:hypothetical protein
VSSESGNRTAAAVEVEAERLAGSIYGTVVATGVLIAAGDPGEGGSPDAVDAAIYAVATTVVFWLAHGLSGMLARRAAGHPEATARAALRREWPMVAATAPLLLIMGAATLLGASDETAISAAVWGSVAVLASLGVVIARRERATGVRAVVTVLGAALLGGLLVVLKVIVH